MNSTTSPHLPESEEEQRVLVAVMTNQRDLRIAQEQGWYRIPLKRAPKQIAADYLAFYQTSAFPEERWAIHYYAPIKSYRLATRVELLPDEPDHPRANDDYYKIEIGPLQRLPKPIPSGKLRRVTFIATTWRRLLQAQEINDLWEGPPSAGKLWEALCAEGMEAERQYEIHEGRASYCLDLAIFCRQGKIGVECIEETDAAWSLLTEQWQDILRAKGWSLLRFNRQQLEDPPCCLQIVRERIMAYGGIDPAWLEGYDES